MTSLFDLEDRLLYRGFLIGYGHSFRQPNALQSVASFVSVLPTLRLRGILILIRYLHLQDDDATEFCLSDMLYLVEGLLGRGC